MSEERILALLLRLDRPAEMPEIADRLGLTQEETMRHLTGLMEQGLVRYEDGRDEQGAAVPVER